MNIKKIYLYSLILTIIIIISATYIIAVTPNPGHAAGEIDLTPLYIDTVNGRVGIGTAGPGKTLEVRTSGTTNFGLMSGTGATGLVIEGTPQGLLTFNNQNGEIMQMQLDKDIAFTGGNVGIGTTSPSNKLTVSGSANTQILGVTDGVRTFAVYSGELSPAGSGVYGISIGTTSNVPLAFYTGGIDKLTIDTGGNVNVVGDVDAAGFCINGDCKTSWTEAGVGSQWTTSGSDIYYNTGNVGIGTTPSAQLHIKGPDSGPDVLGKEVLRVETYMDPNLLSVMNYGDVGIGTNLPSYKLTVSGSANTQILGVTDGVRTFAVYSGALAGGDYGISIGTTSNVPLALYTNGIDRLTIDTAGNVNVANEMSTKSIKINPSVSLGATAYLSTTADDFRLSTAGNKPIRILPNLIVDGNVQAAQFCLGTSCITSWPSGTSQWYTSGNNIYNPNWNTGNVGIGTPNPTGKLSIQVASTDTTTPALLIGKGTNNYMIMLNNGNVGIGTITAPSRKLQVVGVTNLQGSLVIGADVTPSQLLHVEGNAYIKNNVGIGTTIPEALLHVKGPTTSVLPPYIFRVETYADSNAFSITSTGQVGIGTATPSEKLEVVGNVKATGFCIGTSCITSWPTGTASQWTTSGNDIYYNAGKVGIGTTNPSKTLDIKTSGTTTFGLTSGASPTGLSMSNDMSGITTFSNPNGEIMQFLLNRNVIINAGKVGIGTTTPSANAKLEVAGQIKITGGSPALGKVLTSDATGLASWQPAVKSFYYRSGSRSACCDSGDDLTGCSHTGKPDDANAYPTGENCCSGYPTVYAHCYDRN